MRMYGNGKSKVQVRNSLDCTRWQNKLSLSRDMEVDLASTLASLAVWIS